MAKKKKYLITHSNYTIKETHKKLDSNRTIFERDYTVLNGVGNLSEDATHADLAAGVINLVLQAIGTMTVLACKSCESNTVVLTGSVTTLDQAKSNFEKFENLYGIHYIIPENATFATAIGAALNVLNTSKT